MQQKNSMKRGKRPAPVRIPRAHRVVFRKAAGRVAIYWYRRRGEAPALMIFEGPDIAGALAAERAGVDDLLMAFAKAGAASPAASTVRDLVALFKAAPDGYLRLREATTRKAWSPWLDRIVAEFGDLPVKALKAKGLRRDIIAWRNRWADRPRSADYAIQVLQRVLSWALDNELVDANPAAGIKGLYRSNRANVIVEEHELQAIIAKATKPGALAIRLAAATGMRRGDLIDLRWSEVGEFSIERSAEKSTAGRRLLIPLTAEARAVIADLKAANAKRKVPSTYVLTSSRGPWQKDGLGVTWWKACRDAGVTGKHFHDLRGTAATRFCQVPLTDEEVADIMGWEPEQVRAIRKRYVDRERIARGIVARLERAEREA